MPPLQPQVTGFYDEPTGSVAYVAACPETGRAAIIDPVWNFDANAGRTWTESADQMLDHVAREGLSVEWILDTHPHADHFSAAAYLKDRLGAPTGIGEHVVGVQRLWQEIYDLPAEFPTDGSQWDRLWADGDSFRVGSLDGRVMFSPGHTMASVTYVLGDAAFVHDTIFQPDFGTARADFPGADPAQLYRSIRDILALPDETRLFTGHDYRPNGRPPAWESTVGEQKAKNPHLKDDPDEATFVARRKARDAELDLPRNILAALQVNIRGGRLPAPEANGTAYLKIPLNRF